MLRLAIYNNNQQRPKVRDLIIVSEISGNQLRGVSIGERYDIREPLSDYRFLDKREIEDTLNVISNQMYSASSFISSLIDLSNQAPTAEEAVRNILRSSFNEDEKVRLISEVGTYSATSDFISSVKDAIDVRKKVMDTDLPISVNIPRQEPRNRDSLSGITGSNRASTRNSVSLTISSGPTAGAFARLVPEEDSTSENELNPF